VRAWCIYAAVFVLYVIKVFMVSVISTMLMYFMFGAPIF
jgi:hypothetical protein